jgi:hypothetical protein
MIQQNSSFDDSTPINMTELAKLMRVSRATVCNWRAAGYEPLFGCRTTGGHCKEWLSKVHAPKMRAQRAAKQHELEASLAELN